MAIKYSINAKLYYKVGGVSGGGSWTELAIVKDNKVALDKGEVDITSRQDAGWEATGPGLKSVGLDFDVVWDPANAAFAALLDSYLNDSIIGIRALDTASGNGPEFDAMVFKFERNEQLKEAMTAAVTVKRTAGAAYRWVTNGS